MADRETSDKRQLTDDGKALEKVHVATLVAHALVLCTVVLPMVVAEKYHDLLAIAAACCMVALFALQIVLKRAAESVRNRNLANFLVTRDSREQIQELFAMTDMLQAAETYEDAGAVLMATARRLLPGYGAALFVFNNSRDRLDLARAWDMPRLPGARNALPFQLLGIETRQAAYQFASGGNPVLCAPPFRDRHSGNADDGLRTIARPADHRPS